MNQGLSALPSFCPSVLPYRSFYWDWLTSSFLNSAWCQEPCVVECDRARFFEKNLVAQKRGKMGKKWPKIGLFKFIRKFSPQFFWNLVYNESLYYLLYSCTNPIFGKNLVPEIWVKMLLVNQIAGFLNQLYLQNTMIKKPDFLHVDRDSWKTEVD